MTEGLPQIPEIIFLSGDKAYYVRDVPVSRGGTQRLMLYMILPWETRRRYGIEDNDLDFTLSGYGVYKREYPAEYLHKISGNPENPMYLMMCGFKAEVMLEPEIAYLKSKLAMKAAIVFDLQAELALMRDKLREAGERLRIMEREDNAG